MVNQCILQGFSGSKQLKKIQDVPEMDQIH